MNFDFNPYFAPDTGAATAETDTDESTSTADAAEDEQGGEQGGASEQDLTGNTDAADAANQEWDINELQKKGELEDSLAAIGGRYPGDENEDGQDDTSPTGAGEESADEDDTAEGEAAEGEAEGEGAEAEVEDETEEEKEGEEEEEDTSPELDENVRELANQHFPDRVVETEDDLSEAMEEYRETAEMYDVLDRLAQQDDNLTRYLELRLQEDMSDMEAAFRAFHDVLEMPDPEEEPEKYADWKSERELAEKEAAGEEVEEDELDDVTEEYERQTEESFQQLKQEREMGEQEFTRFVERVNTLVYGDENGNVPSDQAERLWFALHKDEVIEQAKKEAYEKGKKEGKNETIEEETTGQRGDGLPSPSGSSETEEELTDEEKEIERLGQEFEQRQVSHEDFAL